MFWGKERKHFYNFSHTKQVHVFITYLLIKGTLHFTCSFLNKTLCILCFFQKSVFLLHSEVLKTIVKITRYVKRIFFHYAGFFLHY